LYYKIVLCKLQNAQIAANEIQCQVGSFHRRPNIDEIITFQDIPVLYHSGKGNTKRVPSGRFVFSKHRTVLCDYFATTHANINPVHIIVSVNRCSGQKCYSIAYDFTIVQEISRYSSGSTVNLVIDNAELIAGGSSTPGRDTIATHRFLTGANNTVFNAKTYNSVFIVDYSPYLKFVCPVLRYF
jgi:hypothetical protein